MKKPEIMQVTNQNKLAASFLMYNRVILEVLSIIILPFYSIAVNKYGPKLLIIMECLFVIAGGIGYVISIYYIEKQVLNYILLSTAVRSLSAMHGVFFIAASTAISLGYSAKQLTERHHWLFSARFIGAIIGFYGQGILKTYVGDRFVMLLSVLMFTLAVVTTTIFINNHHIEYKMKNYTEMNSEKQKVSLMTDWHKENDKNQNIDDTDLASSSERTSLIHDDNMKSDDIIITGQIVNSFRSIYSLFSILDNNSHKSHKKSVIAILFILFVDKLMKVARKDTIFLYLLMSGWNDADIGFLLGTESLFSFLMLIFGAPFVMRVLNLGDYMTCALSLILRAVAFIWFSLRTSQLEVYLSVSIFLSPTCLLLSALHSALSKLVPTENHIRIFSLIQYMESIANILGTIRTSALQSYIEYNSDNYI